MRSRVQRALAGATMETDGYLNREVQSIAVGGRVGPFPYSRLTGRHVRKHYLPAISQAGEKIRPHAGLVAKTVLDNLLKEYRPRQPLPDTSHNKVATYCQKKCYYKMSTQIHLNNIEADQNKLHFLQREYTWWAISLILGLLITPCVAKRAKVMFSQTCVTLSTGDLPSERGRLPSNRGVCPLRGAFPLVEGSTLW